MKNRKSRNRIILKSYSVNVSGDMGGYLALGVRR